MKNVMALLINSKIYLFEDQKYNSKKRKLLEAHAQNMLNEYPELTNLDNTIICERYIQSAKEHLDISLTKLNISFIVRINK